jgi:hypothetical protein
MLCRKARIPLAVEAAISCQLVPIVEELGCAVAGVDLHENHRRLVGVVVPGMGGSGWDGDLLTCLDRPLFTA